MSKIVSSQDALSLTLLEDLGISDKHVVSIRLAITSDKPPRLFIEKYVSEDDFRNIKKFMHNFELKDTQELED